MIGAIGLATRYQNAPAELIGRLLFGGPVTFFLFWVTITAVLALWSAAGRKPWGRYAVVISIVFLAVLLCASSVGGLGEWNLLASSTPTAGPTPTSAGILETPTPPLSLIWPYACLQWDALEKTRERTPVCVYGDVVYRTSYPGSRVELLHFAGEPNTLYVLSDVPFDGDCVAAVGTFGYDTQGTPYVGAGHIYNCRDR